MSASARRPIPFTVIGGFLGAGKTTLLNNLLRGSDRVRYAVLVNDFGELNIDAELIARHDGETIALANGCLCCSLSDGLIETLAKLLEMEDPADHIVVEASGVAEPRRIADIAVLEPDLASNGVLVLADAAAVRTHVEDRHVGEVVTRQLTQADVLILNKIDLVDAATLGEVRDWLAVVAPEAPVVEARDGGIDPRLLDTMPDTDDPDAAEPAHEPHPHLRTVSLVLEAPVDRAAFEGFAAALPASVIRGKGVLRTSDGATLVWQRVGRQSGLAPVEEVGLGGDPSRLLFIGTPEMPDEATLRAQAEKLRPGGVSGSSG